jgi:hypothetical protein
MALPDKLYPNVDFQTAAGFTFKTRDPAKEMEYTVKTLAEIMSQTGSASWAGAEAAAGNVLKDRFNAVESSLYSALATKWTAKLSEITSSAGGTNADIAYSQYLLGMSAAFGGGHTNTAAFAGVNSNDRRLAIIDTATKNLQTLVSLSHGSTSAMPLVVPLESQLVSDAHASAIEADAMGQIRAQQIKQSAAAGAILSAVAPNQGSNPTPYEEVLAFASVNATGAAAATK